MRIPGGNERSSGNEPEQDNNGQKPYGPLIAGAVVVVIVLYFLIGKPASEDTTTPAPATNNLGQAATPIGGNQSPFDRIDDLQADKLLTQQVCSSCHLPPDPEVADRFTWAQEILPRMNDWLGYKTVVWTNEPGGDQVLASGKVPMEPVIDLAQLKSIHNYFMATAPLKSKPQVNKPPMHIGLKHFRILPTTYRNGRPLTTLVKIDEQAHLLYVADATTKKLAVLNPAGKVLGMLDMPNPIVHLLPRPEGFYASMIGSVFPSDLAQGEIALLYGPKNVQQSGGPASKMILKDLRRPVETAVADFNQDGLEDIVVASYGNILGHFSWFEQKPDGTYEEHILLDRPGAVGVKVHDFDGDGRPDIVVTMAQAQEGISVFFNRGHGKFEEEIVVQKHPAWGHSHIELVDFNKDGFPDLLVTNGDNGDMAMYANCTKPYHGIRLYMNDGKGHFHEAWFYPMYGAYRAIAKDFDLDGDLDIAAVSFFPNYLGTFKESFVYLENKGNFQFEASTFAESIAGRWITMDAGDLDGDGDPDIVLGAFNRSFGDIPQVLGETWDSKGPSILMLENTIR